MASAPMNISRDALGMPTARSSYELRPRPRMGSRAPPQVRTSALVCPKCTIVIGDTIATLTDVISSHSQHSTVATSHITDSQSDQQSALRVVARARRDLDPSQGLVGRA